MPPHPQNLAPPTRRVVVAGVGLISPIGFGAWPTFRALLDGRSVWDRAAGFEADDGTAGTEKVTGTFSRAGGVSADPLAIARGVGHVAVARRAADDPTAELAERAAREACGEAGVDPAGVPTWLGTSKGAVAATLRALDSRDRSADAADPLAVALGPQGYLSRRLAARLGVRVRGHRVAACASSLLALDAALRELRKNKAGGKSTERRSAGGGPDASVLSPQPSDLALVLTAEAALLPHFVASYRRLGVLADPTPGGYRQAPLDASRRGFVLSELAAAVVLKALPPGDSPAPGDVELVDTAAASEAFDLIRPSPTMHALGRVAAALLAGRPIDVLHPHAPGTPEHDPAELRVLADVLNAEREHTQAHRPVDVYAVKGGLGHGLGAAGLVSLAVACLAARARRRPPMPWLVSPVSSGLPLRADAQPMPDDATQAVFAAGFGGPAAGAVIRRHP